jgi:O-antigen/teichoic acid export membrane protein
MPDLHNNIPTDSRHGLALKTFYYFLGSCALAIVPFILLPIMVKYLTISEIGRFAFFEGIFLLLLPLVGFGASSFLAVRLFSESERLSSFITSIFFVPLIIGCLCLLLVFLFVWVGNSSRNEEIFWYLGAVVVAVFNSVTLLALTFLQMHGKARPYCSLQVTGGVVQLFAVILLVVGLDFGPSGRVLGLFLSILVTCILGLRVFSESGMHMGKVSSQVVIETFRFGGGIVFHTLAAVVFFTTDRILLGLLVSEEAVGDYFIAAQVGMVMSLVQTTFSQVWTPICFEGLRQKWKPNLIGRYNLLAVVFMVSTAGILYFLIEFFISEILGEKFTRLIDVTRVMILAYMFLGMYKVFSCYIQFYERTGLLSFITVCAALLNFGLTYWFVGLLGVLGAAVATAVSSCCYFLGIYICYKYVLSQIGE